MASVTDKKKNSIRSKSRRKTTAMTIPEMFQKMLADQKIIREAIQNGVSFKELKEKYGFKFATI